MPEETDPFSDLGSQDPFTDLIPSFKARASGYHPVDPGSPEYSMEGGRVGASEWHGQKLDVQEPLYTLDQYRKGKAPYVSVAMDNSTANPIPYGQILESPDMPGVAFRVMDTGSAFNGKTLKYGGPKGLSRIDIARDTNSGANSAENNRDLTFQIAGEDIRKRIEEFPKIAGERTVGSERSAAEPSDVKGDPFADLIPKGNVKPSGTDPFSDLTPAQRGFKGTEPGQQIPEPPAPTVTPTPDDLMPQTMAQGTGKTAPPIPMPSGTPAAQPTLTAIPRPTPMPIPQTAAPQNQFVGTPSGPQIPVTSPEAPQQDPDIVSKLVRSLGTYAGQMIPRSVEQAVQMTGVPTDFTDPFQDLKFLVPPLRMQMDIGQQAYHRMQQIREAEQTPPYSQSRFDAGISTALDLIGMAGALGGVRSLHGGVVKIGNAQKPSVIASTREVPVPETLQPRGATVSEPPAPPVTPPIERPAPQLNEPLQFTVDMPTDTFGTEHTPVSSALHEMKVRSKSGAQRTGRYKGNEDLWNDAPALAHPTHNKIYSPHGEMPDVAAQNLYDAGLISDPYVGTMWNAVQQESKSARNALQSGRASAKRVAEGVKIKATQTNAFIKAEQQAWKSGDPAVPVKDLQVGDTIEVGGEKFKVTDIDPDTYDVTLEDGRKFGVQTVSDNTVIYGEHEPITLVSPPPEQPPVAPPPASTPPLAPAPMRPAPGSEALNPVRGSGKFIRSYRIDKELGDRMEGIGAARESGALRAETESRNLLDGLTPAQEADLGRYLVSRRLNTVNPDHPQIISALESIRIERDPAIAKALDYYKRNIKPDIESWRKRAGLTEKAAAGKEPEFISLIPKTMDLLPQKTATGRFIDPSKLPRTTIFARAAQGLAREYNVQLRDILTESYGESIRKARTREFYDAAVRKGIVNKASVQMPDGNFVKVAQFEDLPPELKHDLTEATKSNLAPVGLQKVGRIYQRVVTGAALTANPAELVNHMRRQLNLVAAKPPIGSGLLARLEALVPYFGPKLGAFKRTIMDNMSTPENQAILRDIYDAGGGSSRSFEELYGAHPKKPFAKALHKYTGLEWLQSKTQKLLFGIPKGYGMQGWDLRMRVQLEKIRRSAEGNVDPQRIREFANQIGQYGRHTSWAVSALKAINPYAATTLPMRATELKTAIGSTGLKEKPLSVRTLAHRGETLARGTGGTILALTTANYLLSGKWPWENDNGHEFDLNTGVQNKNGQTVYVKLRAIAPELSRPVSTVSLPDMSRETTARHPQYASAALTGPLNQAASLVSGPGQNFALTALSGKVPYFLKRPGEGPELMDVAMLKKGEHGKSRGLRQLRSAAAGVNPFGEIFGPNFDVEVPNGMSYIEEPIHGIKPFGRIFSTSYEKKHGNAMAPPPPPPPPAIR